MLNPPTTEEEEEFVVIKAGPPLPLRRPRPLKSNPVMSTISPRPFPNYSRSPHTPHPQHTISCPLHEKSQSSLIEPPTLFTPQPITSVSSSLNNANSVSKLSSANSSTTLPPSPLNSSSTPPITTPTRTPRSRSASPHGSSTSTTTITTLKSPRPSTPSLNVESKVKQYIVQVKKFDEEQRTKKGNLEKKEKYISLEDLYQVPPHPTEEANSSQQQNNEQDPQSQMEDRLRETLRVIKEKDEMINKLRESCHSLKLKWADAENRIDEMRFGLGFGSCSTAAPSPISLGGGGQQGRRSSLSMYGNSKLSMQQQSQLPKRSSSEITLLSYPMHRGTNTEETNVAVVKGVDKATETDKKGEEGIEKVSKTKMMIKLEDNLGGRKVGNCTITADSVEDVDELDSSPDFDLDSRISNFDLVLDEKCSNWLEKIQNWKTDPLNHNPHPHPHNTILDIKDKDSCGDRDSGFRGSAELEAVLNYSTTIGNNAKSSSMSKERHQSCTTTSTTPTSKSTTRKHSSTKPKTVQTPQEEKISTFSNMDILPFSSPLRKEENEPEIHAPLSIHTMAAHFNQKQEQQEQAVATFLLTNGQQNSSTNVNPAPPTTNVEASLQFAQPWHTFNGNVNPTSATDYEGFPSFYSSSSSSRLDKGQYSSYNSHHASSPPHHHHHRSISMDRLHSHSSPKEFTDHDVHRDDGAYRQRHPRLGPRSSVCDQRELFKEMDKRFGLLHPLLDSTINDAMRLRERTEDLAKNMLLVKNNVPNLVTVNVSVNTQNKAAQSKSDNAVGGNDFMNSNRFRRSRTRVLHK